MSGWLNTVQTEEENKEKQKMDQSKNNTTRVIILVMMADDARDMSYDAKCYLHCCNFLIRSD